MDGQGIVPTMPVGGNSMFGGEGIWIFALLILLFGANGGFGFGGRDGRAATVEDLNNSANFTRLEGQVMNNGNRIETKADAVYSGICNLGYEIAQQFNATNSQIANCCCENRLALANTNAHIDQSTSKILEALSADKIAALQSRINQLELQNAVAGVVRYPTAMTYSYAANPFCNGYGLGCGGNI